MKKQLLTLGMICGSIISLFSQTIPTVNWHKGKVLGWGNLTKDDNTADRAEYVDKNGNIYVATCITKSSFGATNRALYIGGDSVIIGLNQTAVVVAKFDSTGLLLWKNAGICSNNGSVAAPEAQSLKVSSTGKVYVTFSFQDTISFGSTVLLDNVATPTNKPDIALLELDGATGNIGWSKIIHSEYGGSGQADDQFLSAIDLNTDGQIVFVLATDSLVFRTYNTSGNLLKSKSHFINPAGLSIYSFTAKGPNIVLAASMMNSFTLGATNINKNDGESFVAVFDLDGNLRWVKQVKSGNGPSGNGARIYGTHQLSSGSIYAVGSFWGTCKVSGFNDSLVAVGKRNSGSDNGEELLYMKISASGSIEWLKQANGESSHQGRGIIETPSGKLVMLCRIGSRSFYIGTDSMPRPNSSGTERFGLVYMDTSANITWAKRVNESGGISKEAVNIYTDAGSNLYFTCGTGAFSNVTFPSISPFQEYGLFMFVKSSDIATPTNPTAINNVDRPFIFSVYPNPVSNVLTIQTDQNIIRVKATIMDMTGKIVYKTTSVNTTIDVSSLQMGLYILSIETEQGTSTQKFIKN